MAIPQMRRQGLDQLRYLVTFVDELEKRHDLSQLGSALEITFTQKAGLTAGVKRSRSPFGPRA